MRFRNERPQVLDEINLLVTYSYAHLITYIRIQTRVVVGLLTGHHTLKRHLHVMGISNDPACRKCGTEEDTSVHILCECEALASLSHQYLGSFFGPGGY